MKYKNIQNMIEFSYTCTYNVNAYNISAIQIWEIYRGEPATLHPALKTVEGRAEDLGFGV